MNQLPSRKKNRLENINYTENGVYFITICSKDKKCIFSKVYPAANDALAPEIKLSSIGRILNNAVNDIENPRLQVVFIDTNIPKNSKEYEEKVHECENLIAMLEYIKNNGMGQDNHTNPISLNVKEERARAIYAFSVADFSSVNNIQ